LIQRPRRFGCSFCRSFFIVSGLRDHSRARAAHPAVSGNIGSCAKRSWEGERIRATSWDDQYMRLMIRFDTGAPAYRWLNTSLFIARGRLLGKSHIEYEVCRVS